MKWANEADYVVPILTPNLLREFHGAAGDVVDSDGLVPTSPVINRFVYTLLRSRYVDAGCRNEVVRPVIPLKYVSTVGGSSAVKKDPLLRLVWVSMSKDKFAGRLRGMLAEHAKKSRLT